MWKLLKNLKTNLTIFQKLLIGVIAILILNVIIAYVGIATVNKLEDTSKVILIESDKYNNLQKLKLSINQLLMPANDYLIHGNRVENLNFVKLDSVTGLYLEKSKEFENNHFNAHYIEEIEDIFYRIRSLSKKIFDLEEPIGNAKGAIMMEEMDGNVVKAEKKIDILLASSSEQMNKYVNSNQVNNSKASRIIIVVVIIIIVSLLVGGFFYVKEITKSIKKLTRVAKNVTFGNLKSKINSQTQDEIENFTHLFNHMINVLSEKNISKDYFNSIIHKINESIIITTIEGKIVIVNKATLELLGYKESELIGKFIEKVLIGEHKKNFTVLEENTAQNIFNTYYTKSNEAIPVSFSKSFIYDNNDNKTGVLYLAYNQTGSFNKKNKQYNQTQENPRKLKILEETPLTNRELEVLKLIVKEYSNQEIADKLFISIRTVETHRKHIMEKLHTKSIIGLVHYAIQNSLI